MSIGNTLLFRTRNNYGGAEIDKLNVPVSEQHRIYGFDVSMYDARLAQ